MIKTARIYILFIAILAPFATLAQTVTVIDSEDLKPVQDVLLSDRGRIKTTRTDRLGKADISIFSNENEVCFTHFTYEAVCLTPAKIKEAGYTIKLTRKIFAIQEFIVTANRWEQDRDEVPNRIASILKPDIERLNPQTAADLIALSGEVFVQKSQLGGGSPMIRGFATNRVLIVVDGVRMNNAIYREGNIQNIISLDPQVVESSEVIFGPGAVVYGSDAIGGVMDFHTRKPLLATSEKLLIRTELLGRYSGASGEFTRHAGLMAAGKRISLYSALTMSSFGDLKMGSHKNDDYLRPEYVTRIDNTDTIVKNDDPRIQVKSGYGQVNTLNKLRIKLSDNSDLVFSNHFSRLTDVPRYDRLIQYRSGKLRYGDWYYGPQVWMLNSLQLNLSRENSFFDEASIIAALQDYRESRHDRSFGSNNMNEQKEKVGIFSLNIDFDRSTGKDLIYYGAEFVINDIKSVAGLRNILTGELIPAGSRYPNGKNRYLSASVYAGYKKYLTGRLTFNTGLRYNYVSLNSEIRDNSFYNFPFTDIEIANGALTGSGGLVFRGDRDLSLNVNLSTGFRAPNLDDAGKVFDSAPGIVVVPNPDLQPEYVYNADAGIKKDFGKIIHAELTFFGSLLTNAMVRHDFLFNGSDSIIYLGEPSKVEAMTNTGSARVYGFHMNILANIRRDLRLHSSFNFTEGYEKGGIPLRHAAPLFGSAHLIWKKKNFEGDLYSVFNGPKKFKRMAPSEIEKPYLYSTDENGNPWSPGWVTLNLKLSYEVLRILSLNAGVENILDLRYRPYSSGISAPGRNFIFSVRLKI
jgi:hemoglobin/transferrin/lactoferrin receptor protein